MFICMKRCRADASVQSCKGKLVEHCVNNVAKVPSSTWIAVPCIVIARKHATATFNVVQHHKPTGMLLPSVAYHPLDFVMLAVITSAHDPHIAVLALTVVVTSNKNPCQY